LVSESPTKSIRGLSIDREGCINKYLERETNHQGLSNFRYAIWVEGQVPVFLFTRILVSYQLQ